MRSECLWLSCVDGTSLLFPIIPLDEEIESEPVVNGIDDLTSYDVSPQKKIKSKSKLKRVTKKIRQDAEKLQIRALHQWFSRSFVHEGNFPVDTESLRSKY